MVILRNGRLEKDGKTYIPCIGDPLGVDALGRSRIAQKVPLNIVKGSSGKAFTKTHNITVSFTCPYCGGHNHCHTTGKTASEAKKKAEEKLYPFRCKCGADYGPLNGQNACQTNQ